MPLIGDAVALRTRALDRWVETWGPELAAANFIPPTMRRQLVIVGGAWDTRAYRLGLHRATTVFEVIASPDLLAAKAEAMQRLGVVPRCAVRHVCADAVSPGAIGAALSRAGFETDIPTRWLLDDCLPYLPAHRVPGLLSEARSLGSAPGSGLAALALDIAWEGQLAAAGLNMDALSGEAGLAIDAGNCASLLPPDEAIAAFIAAGWRRARALGPAELRSASLRERWVDGLPPAAIAPLPASLFAEQTAIGPAARDGPSGAVGSVGGQGGAGRGRPAETLAGVCLVLADAEMHP
jgi:methyltransferase (TIGR00027 family)